MQIFPDTLQQFLNGISVALSNNLIQDPTQIEALKYVFSAILSIEKITEEGEHELVFGNNQYLNSMATNLQLLANSTQEWKNKIQKYL